jgi:hypothetical protein|tara:strand:- start:360 stop:623 length:264 start_codon:yes stop_codon:yes gene_type:complete
MANSKTQKPAAKAAPKTSATSQVKTLITDAGKTGMTALAIGQAIGSVTDKMEANDRAAALKKVRVLARKAIGGKAPEYDGRTAIYRM